MAYYFSTVPTLIIFSVLCNSIVSCQNEVESQETISQNSMTPNCGNAISPDKSTDINPNANTCPAAIVVDLPPSGRAKYKYDGPAVPEKLITSSKSKDFQTFKEVYQNMNENQSSRKLTHLTEFRERFIRKGREFLGEEMTDFQFDNKSKKWEDLILEQGGKPIRNIILTSWRSGSNFLGRILHSHPGTYYHLEPLMSYGHVQLRSGNLAERGVGDLRELLNCRYENLTNYGKYVQQHYHFMVSMNPRLGQYCGRNDHEVCWDPNFLTRMCRLFPFQAMKLLRIRLTPAKSLLDDTDLDVRLLLVIRDPRGTMLSRRDLHWCKGQPDCESPQKHCSDMEADFYAAVELRKKYPGRFMVLRYEDISVNPYSAVKKLFNFYRLQYHPQVEKFLDSHTKSKKGGPYSTFRDSKTNPFQWREKFLQDNFDEVKEIQFHCEKAMDVWGYRIAKDEDDMMTFSPVNKPPWKEMIVPEDEKQA